MLEQFTSRNLILVNPKSTNKVDLFIEMTDVLYEQGIVSDKKAFHKSLLAREAIANTEIIPNVAIPHTGCSGVEKLFLLIVISKEGIDYDNRELGPVNIVFLFGCSSQNNREYLKLLAKSARLLNSQNFREKLVNSQSPDEVLAAICTSDCTIIDKDQKVEYLLIITLYNQGRLPALLSAIMETGINNASIINSSSMAKRIAYEIPVFAGLNLRSKKKQNQTSTVICTVSDNRTPNRLAMIMKENNLDLNRSGNGFMQIFKLKSLIGVYDEFPD